MDQSDIFADRPMDDDVVVMGTVRAHYDGIPVLIERWVWDGIRESSCIVPLENLQAAGKSREDIVRILKAKLLMEGSVTVTEVDGFLFLNFGFKYDR